MADTPKTILLVGDGIGKEAVAAGAITPGHIVELTSAGAVQAQSTAGAICAMNVARPLEISNGTIDTAYAADDTVLYFALEKGAEFYGFLADGENVAIGALLEADGAGGLQALTTGTAIAIAKEALNNTSGSQARLIAEVI